jgi:hypothetical protein
MSTLIVGDWVVVKCCTKKSDKMYLVQKSEKGPGNKAKFIRISSSSTFYWPNVEDKITNNTNYSTHFSVCIKASY